MGLEASGAYQPSDIVRFDAALSVGNWNYLNDVSGEYRPDEGSGDVETFDFFIADLKVGDAPQVQLAYAASVFPVEGLYVQAVGRTYGKHYSDFSPFSRTTTDDRAVQPWQAPGYSVFDFHASYRLTNLLPSLRVGDLRVFANIYNVFDKMYVQDATDNSSFNDWDGDHDADDAEIFLGLPRTFNAGFQVIF
jgi:outer membrane receptor protein involved in Fe transport